MSARPARVRSVFALLVVTSIVGPTAAVWAQQQDPRVAQAKTACAAGDVATGVRLLAEIYTLTNDPIWVFNQGRCYQQNGNSAQALARFREFLRKRQHAVAEDVTEAEGYVKELEAELARAAPPPAPPPGAAPRANEKAVGIDATQRPRAGDEPRPWTRQQKAGLAVSAAGIVGLAAGGVFTLLMKSAEGDVETRAKTATYVDDPRVRGRLDDGRRYRTLQWVGYGAGLAALVGGATLFWLGQPTDPAGMALRPIGAPGGGGALVSVGF